MEGFLEQRWAVRGAQEPSLFSAVNSDMFSFQLFQNLKNLMNPYRVAFESPLELSAQGNLFPVQRHTHTPLANQSASFRIIFVKKAVLTPLSPAMVFVLLVATLCSSAAAPGFPLAVPAYVHISNVPLLCLRLQSLSQDPASAKESSFPG